MLSTVAGTSALKTFYLQAAENILGSLSSSHLGPSSGESVLFDGYPGVNGMNTALIYGDYYFTEALLRFQNVLDGQPGWVGFTGPGFAIHRMSGRRSETSVRRMGWRQAAPMAGLPTATISRSRVAPSAGRRAAPPRP
jgi:hypothetical protein